MMMMVVMVMVRMQLPPPQHCPHQVGDGQTSHEDDGDVMMRMQQALTKV